MRGSIWSRRLSGQLGRPGTPGPGVASHLRTGREGTDMARTWITGMVVGLAWVVAGCTSGADQAETDVADSDAEVSSSSGDEPQADEPAESQPPGDGEPGSDVAAPASSGPGTLEAADTDRRVIRDGRFTVVYDTTFDDSFAELSAVAERLGGEVSGVSSESDRDGTTTGTVTLKVPAAAYDELLLEVAELGEVAQREVTEEDVTGEYVDLRSRLRHLERQEAFYLELFDEAEGVSDAIALQEHLERVQLRREEAQGRLNQLDELTQTSTLRVRLVPDGHRIDGLVAHTAGFGEYWERAVSAFVTVSGTLLVALVGGAPLALAAIVVLAVAVALVKALRRPPVAAPDGLEAGTG